MAQWVSGFVVTDTAELALAWADVLEAAEKYALKARGTRQAAPARTRLTVLRRAYLDFNSGLRQVAERASVQATRDMRQRLADTTVRTDTGETPHLRDLIFARPLNFGKAQTGWVGVGDVAELERARNRNSPGYGSYWRAQEYGTGHADPQGRISVPSQIGRIIFGVFAAAGGGDATPPQAQYAGGGGPHPVFLTKRPIFGSSSERAALGATGAGGTRAGTAGMGTIGTDIAPKRFIGVGKDAAAVSWRDQIAKVQQRAIQELSAI